MSNLWGKTTQDLLIRSSIKFHNPGLSKYYGFFAVFISSSIFTSYNDASDDDKNANE